MVIPVGILKIASLVAALHIVAAVLPNGDVVRTAFAETQDGVRASVEQTTPRSDVVRHREQFLRRGKYTWKIEVERLSILMAPPGGATGVVRQAFSVAAWQDVSRFAADPPRPVEVFRFYAPTRDAAEGLRERLKKALRP